MPAQRAAKIRLTLNPSIPFRASKAASQLQSRPQLFCSDRSALQSLLRRPKFSGRRLFGYLLHHAARARTCRPSGDVPHFP